jgi:L-cysteine:1D-myo-inositol 2-amino-2-deoxy-alpha-D-glucopyranoside ligase
VKAWDAPEVPYLPGSGTVPRIHNTPSGGVTPLKVESSARLYVCGITPYDATHIGHANTYLAYDTLGRVLRDAGIDVTCVQNVTDIDDPLLERANATGADWQELAESQIELFRGDMSALGIIPPQHYVGVVESMDLISAACARLLDRDYAYWVRTPDGNPDLYFDIAKAAETTPWHLGQESGLDRATMLQLSAERGGDPDRPGKRDPLDPLLWRSERAGEPAWDSPIGRGRPGWHIECSVIGAQHLTAPITLNGGGSDLIFPHHEMSAAHSAALSGVTWSHAYTHAGMVAFDGEKMSKSRGNLIFVSRLLADGVDPRAIRLALLAHHYRSDWEWTDNELAQAHRRLTAWRDWAKSHGNNESELLTALRGVLADDLDTPGAIETIETHIASGNAATTGDVEAILALLGIDLRGAL